jgi:predicted phage terminase large subunit-like protein
LTSVLELPEATVEVLSKSPQLIGEHSLIYFGVTFFPHLVSSTPCEFHYELTERLRDVVTSEEQSFNAEAAPRGFAKTTWVNTIFPIWCIVYEKKRYMIGISSAATNAHNNLENIKFELVGNKLLAEAFPKACGEGRVWRQDVILTNNGIKVEAVGASMQIRGRLHHGNRPDLIILDDVETDESVATPEQREKLLRWYDRAVVKAGSPKTDYFLIGTVLHTESLLAVMLTRVGYNSHKYKAVISWADRKDLWDEWTTLLLNQNDPDREKTALQYFNDHQSEMLKGVRVLWPERWPYYILMVEYVRDGPYAFSSERQNDPAEADALITRDQIQYYDPSSLRLEKLELVVGGTDPSMGKKQGDFSCIAFVGTDQFGYMYLLSCQIARRKPDDIIADALDMAFVPTPPWMTAFPVDRFLVEEVQFQEYFGTVLDQRSRETRRYLPTQGIKPRAQKKVRISILQPLIKNGTIKFRKDGSQAAMIDQLCNYPHGKDDGPDCLAMIVGYITRNNFLGMTVTVTPQDFGYKYGTYA